MVALSGLLPAVYDNSAIILPVAGWEAGSRVELPVPRAASLRNREWQVWALPFWRQVSQAQQSLPAAQTMARAPMVPAFS
jgi:hypothetical protein